MPSILSNPRDVNATNGTFNLINGDQVNRMSSVRPNETILSHRLFLLMTSPVEPDFLHSVMDLLTSGLSSTSNPSTSLTTAQAPQSSTAPTVEKTPMENPAKTTTDHPSWKDIIIECIALHTEDGVSRQTLKKFAHDKYKLEPTGSNVHNLNQALSHGVQDNPFMFPKGPNGRVKLGTKGNLGHAKNEVTEAAPAKFKKPPAKATVKSKEMPGASTRTSLKTTVARNTSTSKVRSNTAKAKVAASKPRAKAIGRSKAVS